MTKEQAIEILKQRECCRECVADCTCDECDNAFKMAIKALEQQPSEISTPHGDRLFLFYYNITGNKPYYKLNVDDITIVFKGREEFGRYGDEVYELVNTLLYAVEKKQVEQQPSEDCVSRKAVLNTLFYKSDNNCEVVLNKELQDRIKALPPVTPTQSWIPVSERLPEPQEDGDSNFTDWVLVSIRINPYQSIVCSAYYCFSETKWYMERMGCGEITAWQPLPKPYEEKRGNKDGSN